MIFEAKASKKESAGKIKNERSYYAEDRKEAEREARCTSAESINGRHYSWKKKWGGLKIVSDKVQLGSDLAEPKNNTRDARSEKGKIEKGQ